LEDRRPETGDGRPKTEDGRPKTGGTSMAGSLPGARGQLIGDPLPGEPATLQRGAGGGLDFTLF